MTAQMCWGRLESVVLGIWPDLHACMPYISCLFAGVAAGRAPAVGEARWFNIAGCGLQEAHQR
eukprot:679392-Pelagomonas_calceolata.AAC.3